MGGAGKRIGLLWLRALWQRLATSIWLIPSVSIAAATLLGFVLVDARIDGDGLLTPLGFGVSPEGVRSVLSTIAGSTITVVGVTFSLTVVALQMAASQYSPRLLRTFLADRANQAVLSVLLGTFVYALLVLRQVRSATDEVEAVVPQFAVAVALALTLLSVGMLLFFFHHLSQQLRVESILRDVERATLRVIHRYEELDPDLESPVSLPDPPVGSVPIEASRSGYLQAVDADLLYVRLVGDGLVLRIRPTIGSHVTAGTTIAWVWHRDGEEIEDVADVSAAVYRSLSVGFERTLQQDVAFGIRQLVDVAARALSPAVNDPATAVNAIGSLSVLVCACAVRRLGPAMKMDDDGRVRVGAPAPTFAELLTLACDQPLRYGADEPTVLAEILRLLADVGEIAATEDRRAAVRQQLDAVRPLAADVAWLSPLVQECDRTLRAGRRTSGHPDDETQAPAD